MNKNGYLRTTARDIRVPSNLLVVLRGRRQASSDFADGRRRVGLTLEAADTQSRLPLTRDNRR